MPAPASNFVFANFFETELLEDISAGATLIHVSPEAAKKLPIIDLDVYEARLVLWDGIHPPEIVGAIENQQTGYISLIRAREGTSSRPWPAGTQVICSLTAGIINAALQAYFDNTPFLNANYLRLSGGTLTGPLTLSGAPTLSLHAATKAYADSVSGGGLPIAGGTMLGNININGNRLLNLPVPAASTEPVRKAEYDAQWLMQNAINADQAGLLGTAGSSTAYTLGTVQGFPTFATLGGQVIAFTPHVTNGIDPTLNVDGLGAVHIRATPGINLPAGFLIQGTPYVAVYNGSDGTFYLHGLYGNPYNIPLAAGMDYWGAVTPNSSFAFPAGQAISRAAYSALYGLIGDTYGAGNGTTTFNLPDKSGRASVMREAVATRLTASFFGGNSTVLGGVGGAESHLLNLAELPTGINSSGNNSISVVTNNPVTKNASLGVNPGAASGTAVWNGGTSSTETSTNNAQAIAVTSNNTGAQAHNIVQPSIVCNYIMRVL